MQITSEMTTAELETQNRQAALDAATHGFRVFPVRVKKKPDGSKEAIPLVKWGSQATTSEGQINRWWDEWPDATAGMATGDVFAVDLDDRDGKNGTEEYRALGLEPDDALFAVRTPSRGQHLYFNKAYGLTVTVSKVAPGIDTRGEGGFVFAPGSKTVFGDYRIERGDFFDLQHGLLTDVPEPIRVALAKPVCSSAEQIGPGEHAPVDLWAALAHVSSDTGREPWLEIMMAIHHGTGGSEAGLALAQAWSARDYAAYHSKEVASVWRSLGKKPGDKITTDTLFARARQSGWQALDWDTILDEFDDDLPSTEFLLGEDTQIPADTGGLSFLNPDQCADLPARDYVIKRLIAPGQIGCIFGEPGAGKSLIAPRIAYAVAQGAGVFGMIVKSGPVFYVACEDEDGMAGRVAALRGELGAADDFHLVRGCSDLFSPSQIEGQGSPDFTALIKQVKTVRPALVIIDTLAMAMPGVEENDAAGMNQVVQIGKELAKFGAAVVFVHHGTKAEGNTPRGHSVFNGALDFSVMVKAADRNGIVRGVIRKNRNGPPDLDIAFKIGSRRVGTDFDNEPVDAPICLPCDPCKGDEKLKLTKSEYAALALLLSMTESGPVDEVEWRRAATDGMTVSGSGERASRRKAVARALTGLVRKGQAVVQNGLISIPQNMEEDGWEDDVTELLS